MFAYSVTGARKLVHATLVAGVDLQARGWPQREHLSKMTGFKGATGGPWTTDASLTLQPIMYGGKGDGGGDSVLHSAQVAFFTATLSCILTQVVHAHFLFLSAMPSPGVSRTCVALHACVTVTVFELS